MSVLRRAEHKSRHVTVVWDPGVSQSRAADKLHMAQIRQVTGNGRHKPTILEGLHQTNYRKAQMHLAHTVVLLSGRTGMAQLDHAGHLADGQATVAQLLDDYSMSICIDVLQYLDTSKTRVVVELNGNDHVYQYEIIKSNR